MNKHNKIIIGACVLWLIAALAFILAIIISTEAESNARETDHFRGLTKMIEMPEIVGTEEKPCIKPLEIEAFEILPDEAEMEMLAKLVYGEGGGLNAREQAWIVECVFHRVDAENFPDTIEDVILQRKPCKQFEGYKESNIVREDIHDIVVECWDCWVNGIDSELPERFLFFHAEKINGSWHNVFTTRWDYWNGGERWCPVW